MANGKFITIEGGEGGGKSTQARLLTDALRAAGQAVVLTREPGGAPGAEQIRKLLVDGDVGRWDAMTEVLLHMAARRDHLVATVWPALARGEWVVSDRYVDSTVAYQGYGHGLGPQTVESLHDLATGGFLPDLTLILDLPVEKGLRRAAGRGGGEDRYERMGREFHQRLRDGFLTIARHHPHRCRVIDATAGVGDVHRLIMEAVRGKFGGA